MKILVTGAKGMLGTDLIEILSKNHEIIATDINEDENTISLDISRLNEVKEKVDLIKPDIIINVAAFTDVDGCETNEELAYTINAIGPKNLSIASRMVDAKILHISTDYVFSGDKKSYDEADSTGPLSAYGRTKLAGEEFIKDYTEKYFIFRTAWLYGYHGKNFVKTMLNLSKNNEEISVVDDQHGSPTFTRDLSYAIAKIIETDKYGIYHITNSDNCSWYEFSKEIFKIAGNDVKVKAVTSEEFDRPAPRPKYSILNNKKWKKEGFTPLRSYKEALKEYLELELKEY
ncbi:dTDP-4-dehydrorhamnose reductase [Methanobrevibacter curvatus]|uniref:dTDP-4-dehydrorhamnose reductase n=1 Tax=Methanobrevibacter curvatus TaxID=49547 RepID=A0A166A1W2_9EURY|nr:dTDP-4-dehydrorhamnose reductase [Methanobrevibacter curvatus]KZX11459.1 dTDP-4-dehydrorhamnose reductase [Methanobrevibacter curvatus]